MPGFQLLPLTAPKELKTPDTQAEAEAVKDGGKEDKEKNIGRQSILGRLTLYLSSLCVELLERHKPLTWILRGDVLRPS